MAKWKKRNSVWDVLNLKCLKVIQMNVSQNLKIEVWADLCLRYIGLGDKNVIETKRG